MADDTPIDRDGILPGGAAPLERAIADTDGRLDDIDADLVRRAGGPDIAVVPSAFLPARAWGRSVDVWDEAWPEDVQRAAIAAAPVVHAKKGTPFAVRTALDVLKLDTVIVQWWQTVPRGRPYTFTVTAYARARLYDGPLLDARLIRVAYASVLRTKPLSRAFDFKIGAGFGEPLGLAPAATAVVPVRNGVEPAPDTGTRADLGLAPVATASVPVRSGVVPNPDTATRAGFTLASAATARMRVACAVIPVLPT